MSVKKIVLAISAATAAVCVAVFIKSGFDLTALAILLIATGNGLDCLFEILGERQNED